MSLPNDVLDALRQRLSNPSAAPRSMPPAFYRADNLLSAEMNPVFWNSWICVGRVDEVPNIGDYYTLEILGEPLIITREADNIVNVLSNVCRHRGSIIKTDSGNSKQLVCPYHRWTYALDGKLINAPLVEKTDAFQQSKCALPRIRSEEWMGWLFVNLDGKAPGLCDSIMGLDPYVQNYHPEEMRHIAPTAESWAINWKCLAENFMEGYHLTPVHVKTLHPMTPTRLCEKIPGGNGYTGYKSHYNETYQGRTQYHPDMTEEERRLSMMVWIYPSFVAAISPNSAVYMSITPTGPEELQTRWDVIARDSVFESGEAQERHDFAKSFNLEDRARLLDVQKGLTSRFAESGFLAPPDYEGTVWDFYEYMAKKLLQ